MKKPYKNLVIEVVAFEKKDVITASGEVDNAHVADSDIMTTEQLLAFFKK